MAPADAYIIFTSTANICYDQSLFKNSYPFTAQE